MRLKTKLVVTITGLVFLLVFGISWLHLSHSVQLNVEQNYLSTDILAHQVLFSTRSAIESGVRSGAIAPNATPETIRGQIADVLEEDQGLDALLDSIISYSPTVFDITIADSQNRAMISTNPVLTGRLVPPRPLYSTLRYRSLIRTIGIVTGRPRVYDLPLALEERNGKPVATVHIGIRTTFLLQLFRPWLIEAATYTGISILVSLVIAAMVSTLALEPLIQINRRLDDLSHPEPTASPLLNDAVIQVSNKIERISERMRSTEQGFSALKENVEQILSNLQDGIILFTRDGRAVIVSDSVERFLGLDRSHILGSTVSQIFDPFTPLGALVLQAFAQGQSIPQCEIETGTGRCLSLTLELIGAGPAQSAGEPGEALGALLTLHDLESVREIEDELELSQRLAAIGRLTGGVGHEVKNPINAIVVHLELLRTKLSGDEAPALRHLNIIQSEIQRLDRVVQSLVDFSRPVEPHLTEQDFAQVVAQVLQLASAELATRNILVANRIPANPVPVKIDNDMMRQALLNIVLNGAQAMPDGGTLTLELTATQRDATLRVTDSGTGIPPEILPHIFDLYFTTKKEGSGIGLAMTYRIVQLHSGVIEAASQPSQGTTFTLRLPSASPSAESRVRALARPGSAAEAPLAASKGAQAPPASTAASGQQEGQQERQQNQIPPSNEGQSNDSQSSEARVSAR